MTETVLAGAFGTAAVTAAGTGAYLAMTDAVAISIVTSSSAVIMAGISAYFAYKAKTKSEETHKIVNSQMEAFKGLIQTSAKAEGKLEEKTENDQRQQDIATGIAQGKANPPLPDPPKPDRI